MTVFTETKNVTIYTDGACIGNPGPGGCAAIIMQGTQRKELFGGYRLTTNNRMEIMPAIVGLEALQEPCDVKLCTDSKYLEQSMTLGWARRWRDKGWRKGLGKRLNWDLWQRLLISCAKHNVDFVWVRGHAGNVENERCDFLSVEATLKNFLDTDAGYEELLVHRQEAI